MLVKRNVMRKEKGWPGQIPTSFSSFWNLGPGTIIGDSGSFFPYCLGTFVVYTLNI